MVTYHSITLGQFPARRTVQYYVTSCDTADNCATNSNGGSYYSFTLPGPILSDYNAWRVVFDTASDFNYKDKGSWPIKVWLYNQNETLTAGKTLRLTITRISDGTTAVSNQLMTDNGDGSYQYTATIPNQWNNDWARVLVSYNDPNNNLNMIYHRMVFVKASPGSSDRPWKIEPDSAIAPYTSTNSSYTVKVWLYNAQNATMPGENLIILAQSETGPIIALNLTMTDNGNGSYQYTIPNGTLSNATDYRVMTFMFKIISSRIYETDYTYTVEGVS
jgi:hypothetical protein